MLLPDGRMAIQVYNFPVNANKEDMIQKLSDSLVHIRQLTPLDVSVNKAASQSVKLRFKHGTVPDDIKKLLADVSVI